MVAPIVAHRKTASHSTTSSNARNAASFHWRGGRVHATPSNPGRSAPGNVQFLIHLGQVKAVFVMQRDNVGLPHALFGRFDKPFLPDMGKDPPLVIGLHGQGRPARRRPVAVARWSARRTGRAWRGWRCCGRPVACRSFRHSLYLAGKGVDSTAAAPALPLPSPAVTRWWT